MQELDFIFYVDILQAFKNAVPRLRRSGAGLSPRRPVFDTRSVHVRFVVDEVALGQIFLPVLRFPLSVPSHQCSVLIFICMLLL
jgi:hypothetical protein